MSASDEDADNNGAIIYSLSAPYNAQDLEYFEIQAESGWIVLKKPLDVRIRFILPHPPPHSPLLHQMLGYVLSKFKQPPISLQKCTNNLVF